ncbi:dTMP kinase [Qipengyuania sediminis]|uniref:dTMP kinase n=1 Tax=Qipengyuania sediminis TaxID=1532023 RepID=UPI001059AC3F|nr:dTMP kinase [Qipengyuania sediminis]
MELGRFIAFEGGEGAGKSTQAHLLAEELEERGIRAVVTREPGGTPGAEAIRTLLLEPPGEGWGAPAEALLFAAARADHVARLIRPQLETGAWVICDRYLDSSRAYQGAAGELGDDAIRALHAVGSGGLLPDLTIVLDAPPTAVAARLAARDGGVADAIGGRDAEYHERVAAAFRAFAMAEPQRFARIDGTGSAGDVAARVWQAVERLC